jgi:ABC-2 type transport system permease protein
VIELVAARAGGAALPRALRSEWTKLRTLRSTAWTVAATVVLAVGFAALLSLAGARKYAGLAPAGRPSFDPAAVSLSWHVLAQLAVAVLGVLAVTGEYATGMIAGSLTAVPRRGRLLIAKAVVPTALALVVGEICGFAGFFVGQAVLADRGVPHVGLGDPGVLRAVIGAGLYLAVIALLGVAVGTLVRATAGAVALMVAGTLLVPVFTPALPDSWARVVGTVWPTMAGERIMTVRPDPHLLGPWTGFGLFCAAVAGVLACAYAAFEARDA